MAQMRVRRDDLVWQQLDDEVVVLNLRTSQYLRINETGVFLWRLLEQGMSLEGLAGALTDEYEIDETTAARDVQSLLETLDEHGLLIDV